LKHYTRSTFLDRADREGCVIDFHALRHTYVSTIVASGESVKVAQELARHSTPTLTIGRYAHVGRHNIYGRTACSAQQWEACTDWPKDCVCWCKTGCSLENRPPAKSLAVCIAVAARPDAFWRETGRQDRFGYKASGCG